MEHLWDGRTEFCSNGPGHMTQMAIMPIYEACSEIIETLAFCPEHIDVGKQNSA